MKRHAISLSTAVILLAAATASSAQNNMSLATGKAERPASQSDTTGSGMEHNGIGSTGWTGGSRSPGNIDPGSQNASKVDPEASGQQPEMATGADLLGPPKQFPASKTPE